MSLLKDYLSICTPAPSELLSTITIKHNLQISGEARSRIARHVPLVRAFFQKWADHFEWIEPYAGSTAFPRLKGVEDCYPFVDRLVKEFGILVLPGKDMVEHKDTEWRAHFRVGMGRVDVPEVLEKLDEAFAQIFKAED